MDQDRWRSVNRIFHAALEVEPGDRLAFVALQSNGDGELLAEVELLLQADAEAGTYLEIPLMSLGSMFTTQPPLVPGDVLCERFRIVREIAEGGMGHVFEAFDTELSVAVAVKVIRPEIAATPEVIARFRQEVRLARSITHPNICRTFDLERDAVRGLYLLTMELLAGETLAERLRHGGAIPLAEAMPIAVQMADALGAAHALGIVHRDMKPANVMLVGSRVVITDFGLARIDPIFQPGDTASFSQTGRPIGTLAYMAPEQFEGEPVSPATDIYALGLILYEVVTGKRAFPSQNPLSGLSRRLTGVPPSPLELAPDLPPQWCRAIERCLQVNPAGRPQSAAEVIATLADERRPIHKPSHFRKIPYRAAALLLLLVMVALSAWALRLYRMKANSAVTLGALVYLAPVENRTGDKSLDNMTQLIQADLSQSTHINLLEPDRVRETMRQMTKPPEGAIDSATAREIAMRAGAARVVFATVTGANGSYRLDIDMQQPDTVPTRYREHWTKSFAWRSGSQKAEPIPAELLAATRSAGDWLRHEVGESANDIARLDTPPQDVTTDNWQALAEYADAQHAASRGEPAAAIDGLERAVGIDPRFALAYGRLGDLLASQRRWPEAYAAYRQALSPDLDRHLTRRERDRIKGMYASDSGDPGLAESAFRDYTLNYESDPLGWSYRSYPLELLGKTEDAVASLEHAAALQPHRSYPVSELIACYLKLGRFDEATAGIAQLRADGFNDLAQLYEVELHFLRGDYGKAEAAVPPLVGSSAMVYRQMGLALQVRLRAERNDIAGAIASSSAGVALAEANHQPEDEAVFLLDRAHLNAARGSVTPVLDDVARSVNLSIRVRNITSAATVLGIANTATRGDHSAAIAQSLAHLDALLPHGDDYVDLELAHLHVLGETLLLHGDLRRALEAFERAATLEPPAYGRDYLGRAYTAAAAHAAGKADAEDLERKALAAYEVVALHPGVVWCHSRGYAPAVFADQLGAWLRLAGQLRLSDDITGPPSHVYASLRPATALTRLVQSH